MRRLGQTSDMRRMCADLYLPLVPRESEEEVVFLALHTGLLVQWADMPLLHLPIILVLLAAHAVPACSGCSSLDKLCMGMQWVAYMHHAMGLSGNGFLSPELIRHSAKIPIETLQHKQDLHGQKGLLCPRGS